MTPYQTIAETFIDTCSKYPDKIVIETEGYSYSYKHLANEAKALACHLELQGIQKGDIIAIYMANTWPCIVSIIGATLAGAAFLIINPQIKSEKLHYILEDSGAKILITDTSLKEVFSVALEKLNTITNVYCSGNEKDIPLENKRYHDLKDVVKQNNDSAVLNVDVSEEDLAALIYTSGSTGFPKGVMHTHKSILFAIGSITGYLKLNQSDKIINFLPLAFDYGLYQLFFTIYLGATLILEKSFSYPAVAYRLIKDSGATVFPGVPTIFSILINSHLKKPLLFSDIKTITNTAAALPQKYVDLLQEIFPNARIYKMYGLTECKRVCYLEPELVHKHPTSVGKAIPGTEIFLLDENDNPVSVGQEGILHVRGPHIMQGYWNNPAESKKMLKYEILTGEKILCTHDIFQMDENGLYYFIGRSDDIIKTKGEKVSPVEVENILLSIRGVKDAAILGVADVALGEAIHAFISLSGETSIKEKDIRQVCINKLENFMVPTEFHILDNLPKSSNGKIDKKLLKGYL